MKSGTKNNLLNAPLFPDEITNITLGYEDEYESLTKMQPFKTVYTEDPVNYVPEVVDGQFIITVCTIDTSKGLQGLKCEENFVLCDFKLLKQKGKRKEFLVTPIKKVQLNYIRNFNVDDPHHNIMFYS